MFGFNFNLQKIIEKNDQQKCLQLMAENLFHFCLAPNIL